MYVCVYIYLFLTSVYREAEKEHDHSAFVTLDMKNCVAETCLPADIGGHIFRPCTE